MERSTDKLLLFDDIATTVRFPPKASHQAKPNKKTENPNQVAIDPFRDFTRPKLSDSAPPAFPDPNTLKIRILQENFIGWLFQTNWMQDVTAAMDYEEEQEVQEHIQSYLDGLREDAKFKLVSCDRYSIEEGRPRLRSQQDHCLLCLGIDGLDSSGNHYKPAD